MMSKYWLVGLVAAGATQIVACSSNFHSCNDTRTCAGETGQGEAGEAAGGNTSGSAGKSGRGEAGGVEAGAPTDAEGGSPAEVGGSVGSGGSNVAGSAGAGVAGGAPIPACVQDADCSDHLACNGVETCVAGQCVAGTSPCANPDAAHCATACTEVNGAASCSVHGQDADKDGHFSSACAANPGDDCDDTLPTAYTGAPELCDGIDNNCNQKIDLSDGLVAGGSTVPVAPNADFASIAWTSEKSEYGILYRDTQTVGTSDLYFELLDKTGVVTIPAKAVNDASSRSGGAFDLTAAGGNFAAAWGLQGSGIAVRTLGSGGELAPGLLHLPTVPGQILGLDVASASNGAFGVVYDNRRDGDFDHTDVVAVDVVSPTGTVAQPYDLITNDTPQSYAIAASGARFVISTSRIPLGTSNAVSKTELWDSNLAATDPVDAPGRTPVVASGPNGIGVAVQGATDSAPPAFYSFSAAGVKQCSAVPLADVAFIPEAIVATPNGYLVASGLHGALRVREVHADCSLGALFTIDHNESYGVGIAGSAAGYGIVWRDYTGKAVRRLIGPHYCD